MKTKATYQEMYEMFEAWWKSEGQFECATGQDVHKETIFIAWRSGFYSNPTETETGIFCTDCPDHPSALIRHTFDVTQTVLNGLPAGEGVKGNHRYFCAECGSRLLSLADAGHVQKTAQRIADYFKKAASNLANGWNEKDCP